MSTKVSRFNQTKSTVVTSQIPTDKWHRIIPDPTVADAVMDRLINNASIIAIKGESMRKKRGENKENNDTINEVK